MKASTVSRNARTNIPVLSVDEISNIIREKIAQSQDSESVVQGLILERDSKIQEIMDDYSRKMEEARSNSTENILKDINDLKNVYCVLSRISGKLNRTELCIPEDLLRFEEENGKKDAPSSSLPEFLKESRELRMRGGYTQSSPLLEDYNLEVIQDYVDKHSFENLKKSLQIFFILSLKNSCLSNREIFEEVKRRDPMTKMTVKSSRMSLEVLIKKGLVKRLALTTNRKSLRYKYALESASIEVKDLEFIPPANSPKEKKSYIDRNPETTQYAFRESDGKRYNTDQNQRMNINNPSIVLKSDYNVEDIKSFIKSHGYKSLKNKFKVFLLLKEKSEEEIVQLTANEILSEIKKTDKKLKITLNTISRICRDLTSEGIFEKTCGENIKTGHKIGFYSIP